MSGPQARRPLLLTPGLQVIACGAGWLVQREGLTTAVDAAGTMASRYRALEALTERGDARALLSDPAIRSAEPSLISEAPRARFTPVLDSPAEPAPGDRRTWLVGPAPLKTGPLPRQRLLLVGLGGLGLSVLRELLRYQSLRIRVLDPTPVQPADLDPFYLPEDMGRDKAQLVCDVLQGTLQGDRVEALASAGRCRSETEDALHEAQVGVDAMLCCTDRPIDLARRLVTHCHRSQLPLVLAETTGEGLRIEPLHCDGREDPAAGCAVCASLHRADRDPFAGALEEYLRARFPRAAPWRYAHDPKTTAGLARLIVLTLHKAQDVARGAHPPDSVAMTVDLTSRTVRWRAVAKHHACPVCFPARNRSLALRRATLPRWWQEVYCGRSQQPLDLAALHLRLEPWNGQDTGLFDALHQVTPWQRQAIWSFFETRGIAPCKNALANAYRAVAARPVLSNGHARVVFSEALDFQAQYRADVLALVEGLERLFALDYCPPEVVVRRRYRDIRAHALDPGSFPLFSSAQYSDPTFPLRPVDPDAITRWLWGVNLTQRESQLIPFDLVFGTNHPHRIYQANSNGAACHSSLHQAIVNGVYETVERDALMAVWLQRLTLPRIATGWTGHDPHRLSETMRELGLGLTLVDLTTDLGIPVVLGVVRDQMNPSLFLLNMVASSRPSQLISKLMRELAQFTFPYLINQRHYESEQSTSSDGNSVRTFQDHLSFYQSPEKNCLTAFLTASDTVRDLQALPFRDGDYDAAEELDALVARLANLGYEVLVVNCTTPFLEQLGLYAVKVLIPGLQPLNAGHRLRALGGTRVLEVPQRLGLAPRANKPEDLNPWPHPFW